MSPQNLGSGPNEGRDPSTGDSVNPGDVGESLSKSPFLASTTRFIRRRLIRTSDDLRRWGGGRHPRSHVRPGHRPNLAGGRRGGDVPRLKIRLRAATDLFVFGEVDPIDKKQARKSETKLDFKHARWNFVPDLNLWNFVHDLNFQ